MQNDETFKCLVCGKSIDYANLVEHFQSHKKCEKCKKLFCTDQTNCDEKAEAKGPKGNQEKTIGCPKPECAYSCKRLCDLKRHLIVHSSEGQKLFRCMQCNFTASQIQSLYRHENIAHPKDGNGVMFKCDICNYQTTRSDNLKRHHKTKHKNETNSRDQFVCDICGVTFGSLSALKCHSTTKHEKKTFKCRFCDEIFKLPQCRWRHERITHKECRPKYQCEYCSTRFETNNIERMKEHKRKHIEVWSKMSFRCPNEPCQYGANTKHSLSLHKARCDKLFRKRFPQPTSVIVKNSSFKDVEIEETMDFIHPHVIVERFIDQADPFDVDSSLIIQTNNNDQNDFRNNSDQLDDDYHLDPGLFNNSVCDESNLFPAYLLEHNFEPNFVELDWTNQEESTSSSGIIPERVQVIVKSDGLSESNSGICRNLRDIPTHNMPTNVHVTNTPISCPSTVIVSPPHFHSSNSVDF